MKIETYLMLGEAALGAAELVFKEAAPVVEAVIHDGEVLYVEAKKLFDDAKAGFEAVKTSGIAGTETGKVAATFSADLVTAYANAIQLVEKDAEAVAQIVEAGRSQLALLAAQLAGGQDVTAQPKVA